MRKLLELVACLAALAVAAPAALAQTCWRGRPQPECRVSVITEAGPRLGTDEPFAPLGYAVALGIMVNRHPGQTGVGATVDITTSNESGTYLLTLMPRARRWLTSRTALEAGAGVALLGPGDSPVGLKGFSALTALNYRDLVLLTVAANHETGRNGIPSHTSASIGLRFAAYLGPPVALVSLALAGAASGP